MCSAVLFISWKKEKVYKITMDQSMQNMRDNSVFHLFGYEANLDNNKSYYDHNLIYHNYALQLYFLLVAAAVRNAAGRH